MTKRTIVFTAVILLALQVACLKAIQHMIPQYSVTQRESMTKDLENITMYFDGKMILFPTSLGGGKSEFSYGPLDYSIPKQVRIEWDEEQGSYLDKTLKYIHHTYTLEVKKHLPKGWRKCCDEIIFIFNKDNTVSLRARVFTGDLDDGTRSMKEYDSKGNVISQW